MGLGGQRLFIVPEADLIVMTTSGLYTSPRQGQATLDILYSFVSRPPAIHAKPNELCFVRSHADDGSGSTVRVAAISDSRQKSHPIAEVELAFDLGCHRS